MSFNMPILQTLLGIYSYFTITPVIFYPQGITIYLQENLKCKNCFVIFINRTKPTEIKSLLVDDLFCKASTHNSVALNQLPTATQAAVLRLAGHTSS